MTGLLSKLGFSPEGGVSRIQKGGSARSFFRFGDARLGMCIFCEYSAEKEENFLYAGISEFLRSAGVRVPRVHFHDPAARILVMEDFGERDLLDFSRSADGESAERAYMAALSEAAKIHTDASRRFAETPVALMPKFDDALYAWEQDYFYGKLVRGFFSLGPERPEAEWAALRQSLLGLPECLVHRDFQSQNVIVGNGGLPGLIDFQGMRLGSFWYDVASLLCDPYASLPPPLRERLYRGYCAVRGLDSASCLADFYRAASQRLMQALGAFAFLSLERGKTEYVGHIPAALGLLAECAEAAGLSRTASIARLCEKSLAANPHICEFYRNAK